MYTARATYGLITPQRSCDVKLGTPVRAYMSRRIYGLEAGNKSLVLSCSPFTHLSACLLASKLVLRELAKPCQYLASQRMYLVTFSLCIYLHTLCRPAIVDYPRSLPERAGRHYSERLACMCLCRRRLSSSYIDRTCMVSNNSVTVPYYL